MPKGKINSTDNLPPPQTRSLRSRKKETQNGESGLTDDVQTTLCLKDTGSVAVPIQNPLKESAVIVEQHHQAAERPFLSEQDGLTKEKGTEMRNGNITNVAVTGQEQMDPCSNSQLDTCGVNTDTVTKKNRENMEETASEQCNRSPNQNCTDHLQVSKDHQGSTALEKQMHAKANSNLQKNQDTTQGKPSTCTIDVKESTAGSPAKKKRRMSTLGLTEKDQSDLLQTQMREKLQNEMDSAGKPICDNAAKSVALEEKIFSPVSSPQHVSADFVTERSETDPTRQSSNHQDGTEVEIAVASSDGASVLCEPGFAERKTCEAESVSPPGPESPDNPESHQYAAEEETHLEDQQLQEHKETPAEEKAETFEKQTKTGEEKSAEVILSSAGTSPMEESNNKDATEADENKTEDEKKGCMTDDGVEKVVSSADTQTEGFSCGVVTLCEASLTPSVQEVKYKCDPEDNPAPGSSAGHIQTMGPDDASGFRCLDYVSDSQLNTIVLNDEKITEKDEPDVSACLEDATDLIGGLIGELSSLNRKVMAAHRQLENLRRKHPKSFAR